MEEQEQEQEQEQQQQEQQQREQQQREQVKMALPDSTLGLVRKDFCRVAGVHDRVDKTECVYTFHSPFTTTSPTTTTTTTTRTTTRRSGGGGCGIVVNLRTFAGTIPSLAFHASSEKEGLFVRIVQERVLVEDSCFEEREEREEPTTLGIGVPGGFASEESKYMIVSTYSLVHLKEADDGRDAQVVLEVPYSSEVQFPLALKESIDSILHHSGSSLQQDVQAWQMDQSDIPVSKYAADLPFCDNGVAISPDPTTWKCQKSGDTENVWLNLSDGYMGGGRQHWDGSGGSNGALDHYNDTGKRYPLVVKLGTITADLQTADCYSYAPDEDGPVRVPNLEHLLHQRGIDIGNLKKTVKSTAELEVELNANYAFDAITEHNAKLLPVSGPYLQGLANLGNSCYLNSVVQLLFHIPQFAQRYAPHKNLTDPALYPPVSPDVAPTHLLCQTIKLALALTSGAYSRPDPSSLLDSAADHNDPRYKVAPRMFKHVIGSNHVDFATGQQQDAAQFLLYFLEQLDRAQQRQQQEHQQQTNNNTPSSHILSFATQTRSQCTADQKVKYVTSIQREILWSIPIPMEFATTTTTQILDIHHDRPEPEQKRHKYTQDKDKDKDKDNSSQGTADTDTTETPPEPVPKIPLTTCLDQWASETLVEDIKWKHLGGDKHPALQTTKLQNLPPYLIMQLQRYTLGSDWQPVKLQVEVQFPTVNHNKYIIDLKNYKTDGAPHPTEVLVPDDDDEPPQPLAATAPVVDEAALGQLMDMGFSRNACQRALHAVGGSNVEAAMGWVFEHNNDDDFNDPLPEQNQQTAGTTADRAAVQSLVDLLGCFTADQVRFALKETNNQTDRAADWLFSHMNKLDAIMLSALTTTATGTQEENGPLASQPPLLDSSNGCSTYQLMGLISHIGKNTGSGHYVAHFLVDGKWIIFNDEKVAESTQPPVEHAYLYLWQRTDTLTATTA